MTTLKFKTGVRYDGTRYAKNQVKSGFSEKEVALFVENNVAFVVGVPDSSIAYEKDNNPVIDSNTPPADTVDVYKELDDNWDLAELKVDAERIGLEFDAKKILKKDLIKQIIDSGRTEEFLAMLEEDPEE